MTNYIHPTAVVYPGAKLGDNVKIGPYSVVGEHVLLADGVELKSHVVVDGRTTIGKNTVIYPFAAIGQIPQDLKFHGEESRLEVGENNQIREYVTMHAGTQGGGMLTKVGSNCLFMIGVHIAHDCIVGDRVIMANNATLGGHVHVGDGAVIGGLAAAVQFTRIGAYAMVGGMAPVDRDVIPFGLVKGERAFLDGLNWVGLERAGFAKEVIADLKAAYNMIFSEQATMAERLIEVEAKFKNNKDVLSVIEFIRAGNRPICQPKQK